MIYASNDTVTIEIIKDKISEHDVLLSKYNRLKACYLGKHEILSRSKPDGLANNKLVCNHAKYISDTATGYMLGSAIDYKSISGSDAIDKLKDVLKGMQTAEHDLDLALDMSVYGIDVEMIYMSSDDKPVPKIAKCDPREAFVVYDATVEHKPLYGIRHYTVTIDDTDIEYTDVYTVDGIYKYVYYKMIS